MKTKQSYINYVKLFAFLAFSMLLMAITASAEEATYAGKDACKSCHPTEYNKIQDSICLTL